MSYRFLLVLVLAVGLAACDQQSTLIDAGPDTSGEALDALAKKGGAALDDADRYLVLTKGSGVSADFTASVEALGGTVDFAHEVGFAIVSGLSGEQAATIGGRSDVSDIQADALISVDLPAPDEPAAATISSPDDPTSAARYARQWNMRAIDADEAWAAGKLGDESVTVAILDTGIDYTYPDLAGRVDLDRSISFEDRDDPFVEAFFPGKNLVTDLHFHGTHVAATVASNALAAAGVTSRTTLMGVKVCSFTDFTCRTSNVLQGILYAVDNGADVVNMSLGGGFAKAGFGSFVGFINRVFNYAKRNDVTMVVAAGNAATDLDKNGNVFAAYCDAPHTICVSATGPVSSETVNGPWMDIDAPAPYTNFGRSAITVAAPGGSTGGSVWAGCSQTSLLIPPCQAGVFIIGISGTSMATPHVAGLAALLVAENGRNPAQVKAAIMQGADDLGQPGTDKFYGKGRINVAGSLGL